MGFADFKVTENKLAEQEKKKKAAAEKAKQQTILTAQKEWRAANKIGDSVGMEKAHAKADLARGYSTTTLGVGKNLYQVQSSVADKLPIPQAKRVTPIPVAPRKGYLETLGSTVKENLQRNISALKGDAPLVPANGFEVQKRQQSELAQTPFGSAQVGFQKGFLPVSTTKAFEKAFTPEALAYMERSTPAKVGEVAGTISGFALPYATLGGNVVKGTSKIAPKLIPSISKGIGTATTKMFPKASAESVAKIGQSAAESLVKDIVIGLPQNIAYATGKEGLTGDDAVKSIAVNTALDVLLGGALELAPLFLKSGKAIKTVDDFTALPAEEKAEAVQKMLALPAPTAYVSPQGKVSFEPNSTYPLTEAEKFKQWRTENFGGAFGKMSDEDMQALKDLYQETAFPRYETAKGLREIPKSVYPAEMLNNLDISPLAEQKVKTGNIPPKGTKSPVIAEIPNTTSRTIVSELPNAPNKPIVSELPNASGLQQKVRGFSENVSTDTAMQGKLRKTFSDSPETYTVLGNKDTIQRANDLFISNGAMNSYDTVMKAIASNNVMPEHVVLSRKVANELAKNGDVARARNLIAEMSVKLTEAGQFSQSAAILRNSDPMAVLQFLEKTLKKTNDELSRRIKNFDGLKLTDAEVQKLASIDMGDEESIKKMVSEIGKRLSKEIPSTWFEKFDELRRIAMLGNFKTQIRNIVGNIPLATERKLANKVSAATQKLLPKEQRTQALLPTGQSKKMAKELYENDKEWMLSSNKWDTNDLRKILNEEREVFGESLAGKAAKVIGVGNKAQTVASNIGLEGFRKLVYGSLQLGDVPFLKSAYVDRMASYISAKGYKSIDEIPQKVLDTAREEALKATFRDSNVAAKFINDLKRKGGLGGKIVEATVPFVTTPANLVSRTIDYSPVGLIRSLVKMKNAKDVPAAIDEMAQGLTGTALIALGAFYAKNGILIGAADTNKDKANFEKATGKLPFSVQTPFGTVSYDWAQPIGSQLAVASEIYKGYEEAMKESGEFTPADFAGAVLKGGYAGIDVILESSVYQNILDLFSGYGSPGERILQNVADYPMQIVPTMLGQGARAGDQYVRNAFDKTSEIQSYFNRIKAKVPSKSKTLPVKYDTWGRPLMRSEATGARAAQEFLNPANVAMKNETETDKEILSLYERTGDNAVFPSTAPYTFKIDGTQYDLNNDEVSEYQKVMGEYAKKNADSLFKSAEYNGMSDDEKLKEIESIYTDAARQAKVDYLERKKLSPLLVLSKSHQDKYNNIASLGVDQKQYLKTYEATKGIESEKDDNGNTIRLSESYYKKQAIDLANPNATKAELRALYHAFDVSQQVW